MGFVRSNDLNPDLPYDEKYRIIVRHGDGSLEEYLVGPLPANWEPYHLENRLPPEIETPLQLKPDDAVIYWLPPVPLRKVEPTLLPTPPTVYPAP